MRSSVAKRLHCDAAGCPKSFLGRGGEFRSDVVLRALGAGWAHPTVGRIVCPDHWSTPEEVSITLNRRLCAVTPRPCNFRSRNYGGAFCLRCDRRVDDFAVIDGVIVPDDEFVYIRAFAAPTLKPEESAP